MLKITIERVVIERTTLEMEEPTGTVDIQSERFKEGIASNIAILERRLPLVWERVQGSTTCTVSNVEKV